MVRVIGREESRIDNPFSLARMEDVDLDSLKKKYMEAKKNGTLPDDDRNVTEIQASEDAKKAMDLLEFFGLENDVRIDPMTEDPLEAIARISEMLEEDSRELYEKAESQRALNIEEDAAERIEQIAEFAVNNDDPLLSTEFKEKSEKLIQKLILDEEKEERGSSTQETRDRSSNTQETFGRKYHSNTTSSQRSTTGTVHTTNSKTVYNREERERNYEMFFAKSVDRVMNFAYDGPPIQRKEKRSEVRMFGGKKKFSPKVLWAKTKNWFRSREAGLLIKVGIALTLQTMIAVITKQVELDGPGQTVSHLGMLLGLFYISKAIRDEGYDMRRLSMF